MRPQKPPNRSEIDPLIAFSFVLSSFDSTLELLWIQLLWGLLQFCFFMLLNKNSVLLETHEQYFLSIVQNLTTRQYISSRKAVLVGFT